MGCAMAVEIFAEWQMHMRTGICDGFFYSPSSVNIPMALRYGVPLVQAHTAHEKAQGGPAPPNVEFILFPTDLHIQHTGPVPLLTLILRQCSRPVGLVACGGRRRERTQAHDLEVLHDLCLFWSGLHLFYTGPCHLIRPYRCLQHGRLRGKSNDQFIIMLKTNG